MSTRLFELSAIGGPWGRRLGPRRAWLDGLPWGERLPDDAEEARLVWTRTAFSEYASAAAFAEIAAALLAAGAPIDLTAAASDFVVDEIVHAEAAARLAAALGGAVALEVDLTRLVRPPAAAAPLLRAAELVVRTSCVGEAMTLPMLKLSRKLAGSALVEGVLRRVIADEAGHAKFGWWFLDWADPGLDDAARAHLGRVAGEALRAFAPVLGGVCGASGLGAVACAHYDPAFADAARRRVARPLGERGIEVPAGDLAAVGATTPAGGGGDRTAGFAGSSGGVQAVGFAGNGGGDRAAGPADKKPRRPDDRRA
jgi:hypothetical protein